MPGMIKIPGEQPREALTHRDYKEYERLEPQDFLRIHEQDLQALLDEIKTLRKASGAMYVECIDAGGAEEILEVGKKYRLLGFEDEFLTVEVNGKPNNGWFSSRFRVVP